MDEYQVHTCLVEAQGLTIPVLYSTCNRASLFDGFRHHSSGGRCQVKVLIQPGCICVEHAWSVVVTVADTQDPPNQALHGRLCASSDTRIKAWRGLWTATYVCPATTVLSDPDPGHPRCPARLETLHSGRKVMLKSEHMHT